MKQKLADAGLVILALLVIYSIWFTVTARYESIERWELLGVTELGEVRR